MPGAEAATEAEMLVNGGDERAAKALVEENSDTGWGKIVSRLEEAVSQKPKAA